MIIPLLEKGPEAAPPDVAVLGGKGAGLARMIALGLPVPPAVVVPVADVGVVHDPDVLLDALPEPFAVRSSAVAEDAADRSAAGQFDTVMGVMRADLDEAIRRVHASAVSDRALAYGGDGGGGMAIVIQRAVPAGRAGVAFSRDPITGADAVVIECVFGHGERLVSGEAIPDRFVLGSDGSVRARLAPKDGPYRTLRSLRDDEVSGLAGLVRRAEHGFGMPVDVEFCLEGPSPWLVQCRAITALEAPA